MGAELMAWQQGRKQLWCSVQDRSNGVERRVITNPGFAIVDGSTGIVSINWTRSQAEPFSTVREPPFGKSGWENREKPIMDG